MSNPNYDYPVSARRGTITSGARLLATAQAPDCAPCEREAECENRAARIAATLNACAGLPLPAGERPGLLAEAVNALRFVSKWEAMRKANGLEAFPPQVSSCIAGILRDLDPPPPMPAAAQAFADRLEAGKPEPVSPTADDLDSTLAALPHPDSTGSAEHWAIYELIEGASVEEGESVREFAEGVCNEFIAHASAMLTVLKGGKPEGREELKSGKRVELVSHACHCCGKRLCEGRLREDGAVDFQCSDCGAEWRIHPQPEGGSR